MNDLVARNANLVQSLNARLESELEKMITSGHPAELYDPVTYTLANGGKRLRPLLALLACELFDGNIEDAIQPALGIELFHNFTLLHDDIMDQSPVRRGKPTVHAKWGHNTAILAGDVMFVKANELVCKAPGSVLREVLHCFNQTALRVCEGQQMDMNFEERNNVSISEYLQMIEYKTAYLLAGALKTGAIIAGANNDEQKRIFDFGINAGKAFQLKDDLLDVFGQKEKFGKRVGGDIFSKKKTWLLLKALEMADETTRKQLYEYLMYADISEHIVDEVIVIYKKMDLEKLAEKEIRTHYDKALDMLSSIEVEERKKQLLLGYVGRLMKREN